MRGMLDIKMGGGGKGGRDILEYFGTTKQICVFLFIDMCLNKILPSLPLTVQ